MSVFNLHQGVVAGAAAGGGAVFDTTLIGNSVWLDGSADYFSKTYAGSGNSTTEGIFSFWYQRYIFSAVQEPWFEASGFGGLQTNITYGGGDTIVVNSFTAGGAQLIARHTRLLRDVAWYHIIVSIDMSQATTLDKIKFYINGEQDTTINVQNLATTNGLDMLGARSKVNFRIGQQSNKAFAQYCYLDGVSIQQGDYAVSDFLDTFTFGTNGSQIIPKANADIAALATTTGGNSFCLDFADSGDLGNDISSNANDFTPNSMSSANQSSSTPSLNYAVLNTLDKGSSATTSEGATRQPTGTDHVILSSMPIPTTGKWAISGRVDAGDFSFGICTPAHTRTSKIGRTNDSWGAIDSPGASFFRSEHDSVATNSTVISAASDTFIIAFDADSGKLWLGRNDGGAGIAYLGGGDPTTGTTPTYTLSASEMSPGLHFAVGSRLTVSFGQRTHFETLPTGFLELNSENLSTPNAQGIDYFNAVLVTGDATNDRAITGMGFASDLLVYKKRSATLSWKVQDVIRGVNNVLYFDATNAEQAETGFDTINDADGFTINNASNANDSGATYVAYGWLMGGAGAANSDGTIPSTVSASSTGAWSLITWTGTGANGTIGHGLSGAPELVIVKNTNDNRAWRVLETVVNGGTHYLTLNTTAASTAGSTFWNDSNPTASVINLGSDTDTNDSGDTMVAIAFRSVPGVCKVGSYIGNGNADGPYVSVGFSPKWVMVKPFNAVNPWTITDTSRDPINATTRRLHPNLSQAEAADSLTCGDILADGFKLRASHGNVNQSGITYLYLAMADIGGNGTLPPIYGR